MEKEKDESLLEHAFTTFQGYVPKPVVPPRYRGSVKQEELNCNDVLSGKGVKLLRHHGNITLRKLVSQHQEAYVDATMRLERQHIAAKIVATVRVMIPPGRFLMKSEETGHWEEIGDATAREKVRQALRDGKRKLKAGNQQLSNIAPPETSSPTPSLNLQEYSVLISEREFHSSYQNSNKIQGVKSTLSFAKKKTPLKSVEDTRKRISTNWNIEGKNNLMIDAENRCWSDFMSEDLEYDMHIIKDFISDLPAELIESPCNTKTFKKRLTPESFFGSSATTTDYMLAVSRLHCDCDASESSQISFGHVALVKASSFESVPHDYKNLVLNS